MPRHLHCGRVSLCPKLHDHESRSPPRCANPVSLASSRPTARCPLDCSAGVAHTSHQCCLHLHSHDLLLRTRCSIHIYAKSSSVYAVRDHNRERDKGLETTMDMYIACTPSRSIGKNSAGLTLDRTAASWPLQRPTGSSTTSGTTTPCARRLSSLDPMVPPHGRSCFRDS